MIYIYNIFATLLTLALAPVFVAWSVVTGKKRRGLLHHFGILPSFRERKLTLWLYALSMGEVTAAAPVLKLVRAERPDIRIVVSVTTDSGYEAAHKQLGFVERILYHPFDGLPFLALARRRIKPDIFIVTETGFWPGLLHMLRDIPTLLFHGRISQKSMRRYKLLKPFVISVLNGFGKLCMQNIQSREDMFKFGIDPSLLEVIGDTKYDALGTVSAEEQVSLRSALQIPDGCPVIVAGSTHEGEEEIILTAFQKLKADYPKILLILAPRRLERLPAIADLLGSKGIPFVQRSRLSETKRVEESVILLDTMGELFSVYSIGDIAFVGRSLIPPGGGHSLIEPASLGKVVLHGPYMEYNQTVADELGKEGVAIIVRDAEELGKTIRDLLANPSRRVSLSQKAQALIEAKKGASKRMAEIIFAALGNRG